MDDYMADDALELDSLDDNNKPPRPAPKQAQPEPEEDPEETPAKPEAPKPEAEDHPEAEADEPEAQTPDSNKMPARDLRKAYETSEKKIREELQPKITKLEARLKELESSEGEPSVIAKQLTTVTEENKHLRERLAERDYQEHPEYKEKQSKFETQFARARRDLFQLEVEQPDGTTRNLTDQDIVNLAQLPYGKDRIEANKMFGDSAEDVLAHTRKIRELAEDQQNWVEENRKNAGKILQDREATFKAAQVERAKLFIDANKELEEKYPFWFKQKDGDAEGNQTLASGEALTNLMFNLKLSPEQVDLLPKRFREEIQTNGRLSKENVARLHALVRNKAMNHDRIARWMKGLRKELAETKEALAAYEQSEPPTGGAARRRNGSGGPGADDDNAELDRLDRMGR